MRPQSVLLRWKRGGACWCPLHRGRRAFEHHLRSADWDMLGKIVEHIERLPARIGLVVNLSAGTVVVGSVEQQCIHFRLD